MMPRTIVRIAVSLLVFATAPALFAEAPVPAPPYGTERFIVYFSCATGTPQYTGHEEWNCDYEYYDQGTEANRARVSDTDCNTMVGADPTHWCRTPRGIWYEVSESFFNSCHPCFDLEND